MSRSYFVVYDKSTGNVIRSGSCASCDVDSQARNFKNEAVMKTKRWVNDVRERIDINTKTIKPIENADAIIRAEAKELEDKRMAQKTKMDNVKNNLKSIDQGAVEDTKEQIAVLTKAVLTLLGENDGSTTEADSIKS